MIQSAFEQVIHGMCLLSIGCLTLVGSACGILEPRVLTHEQVLAASADVESVSLAVSSM